MGKIDLKGGKSEKHLFHNEWITVYRKDVSFKKIQYWRDNLRTLLDFDLLKEEKGKPVEDLTLQEITEFLVKRPDLKLSKLADSIKSNGVRIPLIILEDGTLIDGNRRYFACSYIYHRRKPEDPKLKVLESIPSFIIKNEDINERLKKKILAEANFVDDFRVQWPLQVRAKVISEFFHECLNNNMDRNRIVEEIKNVYGVEKKDIDAYVETVALTEEYIFKTPRNQKNKARQQVQKKFVYFWEFRNKATRGRGALDPQDDLPKAKKLFFKMIRNEKFDNLKQVEPMIRAKTDPYAWGLLITSNGSKIAQIEAMYKEQKAIKSAEDKVRNFLKWLQNKADPSTFTKATLALLKKLIHECSELLKKKP